MRVLFNLLFLVGPYIGLVCGSIRITCIKNIGLCLQLTLNIKHNQEDQHILGKEPTNMHFWEPWLNQGRFDFPIYFFARQ